MMRQAAVILTLVASLLCATFVVAQPKNSSNASKVTEENVTAVFAVPLNETKKGKPVKNATISPLSQAFCTSKEVDPKKKDLCYAAQFIIVENGKYTTKLRELVQPQKEYTDLREEIVNSLQKATTQIKIVRENLVDESPINIGLPMTILKDGIKRAISNITKASLTREKMVKMGGPRDMWAQNVKDARDEHEKFYKYIELFKYHSKVELEEAKKKVAHLENITALKTKELKSMLDHAERMAKKNKDFVSNPDVDDEAGALALQSLRRATSNAAATKRYLLAIEAELKLAKLSLTKIQMRTAGAAMPALPEILPGKNYAEEQINAIRKAQQKIDEKAGKEFSKLSGMTSEFDVIAKLPGAPKQVEEKL